MITENDTGLYRSTELRFLQQAGLSLCSPGSDPHPKKRLLPEGRNPAEGRRGNDRIKGAGKWNIPRR